MGSSRMFFQEGDSVLITLSEIPVSPVVTDGSETSELRFAFRPCDERHLEALRQARRAMLREEWTLGLLEDEPGLAEAVFTTSQISWRVASGREARCRQKLATLIRRADALIATPARPLPRRGWDQGPILSGLRAD